MSDFFIILIGFFIVVANVIGFISYKRKKNLYFSAFTILLSAVLFGAIGGVLALLVIRDAFAIFYGLQVGYYLLINSVIVFLISILATVIKRYNNRTT
ncbi:putative membrane protein YfcA [Metabacillus crassostreae]|uniref:3-isopropylmalate dehydrogenase n=1 Tax=Metabacillus crassostreae TaxID=929098 RepID=UPI00195B45C4|nr:3-isopropylmalate dehydrogenase [Metabacillus crassostreae]MBM7603072.1 putative membrane protein YfcA [Metabacillus crassostreae]